MALASVVGNVGMLSCSFDSSVMTLGGNTSGLQASADQKVHVVNCAFMHGGPQNTAMQKLANIHAQRWCISIVTGECLSGLQRAVTSFRLSR